MKEKAYINLANQVVTLRSSIPSPVRADTMKTRPKWAQRFAARLPGVFSGNPRELVVSSNLVSGVHAPPTVQVVELNGSHCK